MDATWRTLGNRLLPIGRAAWARRRRIGLAVATVLLAPFLLVGVVSLFTPLPSELQAPAAPSVRVTSRSGELLREVRTDDGVRARPLPLAEFPEHARKAVLAAEDRRFYEHPGVDVRAVLRAAASDVVHARIVSGASTITMQLARTLRPHRRSLWGKVTEMALALRIERSLSKDQILEEYLNRVVYGPNVRGYATASQAYFGKPPASLSLAEAALLAGLPRGPSLYLVTKHPTFAKRRRDRVLARMADAGMIDAAARAIAVAEPLVPLVEGPAFGAPHFVRGLSGGARAIAALQPGLREAIEGRPPVDLETTIDPKVQRAAESAVATTIAGLTDKHVGAAAVVVLENATGDVLAWVGSPDIHDAARLGENDGAIALRQPGSALKPFVYAEAMAHLGYTAATVLPDIELHIPLPGGGDYVPHDYDGKLRGPVRLREALGNSLNVPAVHAIHELGTARVLEALHRFGFRSLTEDAEHYGPALALGDGEVTLVELANGYATLARGGVLRPVRVVRKIRRADGEVTFEPAPGARVADERITAVLADILSDKTARLSAFGDQNVLELEFPVAAKTGTSKGFRDNVAVGFTPDVTVAVWAGNFDGSPMAEVSGIAGAGPIFRAVMTAAAAAARARSPTLALDRDPARARELGLARASVCSLSGEIATNACPHRITEWLPADRASDLDHAPTCQVHARVRIDLETGLRAGPGCDGAVEERLYESWLEPFQRWAVETGRPLPPEDYAPRCPSRHTSGDGEGARAAIAITYPFDGARFVVDPERPAELQQLEIKVLPDGPKLELRIDGAPLTTPRHTWPLVAGDHTITARLGEREARPVRIHVR